MQEQFNDQEQTQETDDQDVESDHQAAGDDVTTDDEDEQLWGLILHLSAFAGFLIPFGNLIGPLIVWQVKKDESRFLDAVGREALNFHIAITTYAFVSALLIMVFIGLVLLGVVLIGMIVLTVIAAVKASDGECYRFPMIFRVL